MTTNCRHVCCEIPGNDRHRHLQPPETCDRCAHADGGQARAASIGQLVASVLARVAPQIPGLPVGPELTALVSAEVLAAFEAAEDDPLLDGLSARERHTVLSGRVGVALAFGGER